MAEFSFSGSQELLVNRQIEQFQTVVRNEINSPEILPFEKDLFQSLHLFLQEQKVNGFNNIHNL